MSSSSNVRLSIGIPSYNQGPFLRETITSLLNQTERPFEIVVSDDYSTDNTQEVLQDFVGRVKVIFPPRHLGMIPHWNFVAKQLNGDWFSLLSSDDIAKPNFVSTLIRGILRSSNAVLVRGGWETIDEGGSTIEKRYLLSTRHITRPPRTFYENISGPKCSFAAFAVRRSAWLEAKGFPEECHLNGDWAFWLRLSPLGNFITEQEIISRYRTNYRPKLATKRVFDEVADEIEINMRVIPEVAAKFSKINWRRIRTASRKRLIRRLEFFGKHATVVQRQKLAKLLRPWAEFIGEERLLHKFMDGKSIHARKKRIKKYIRGVYQKFIECRSRIVS